MVRVWISSVIVAVCAGPLYTGAVCTELAAARPRPGLPRS